MTTIHLPNTDPTTQRIVKAAYPDYKGKKFRLEVTDKPINVKGSWSDGSRTYYTFVCLDTCKVYQMPAQSQFDKQIPGADKVVLQSGIVCVEHHISCGKDMGITIVARPDAVVLGMVPLSKPDLTNNERLVLMYTRNLKSTYAGVSNYRFREAARATGITMNAWELAKQTCIDKGLLNKRGAITVDGRNAIASNLD